jgi:hypothetical protein
VPTRLFTAGRFAVYAVIVALGVHHLLTRDGGEARAVPDQVRGSWFEGRTSQGLPVNLRIDGDRVVVIGFEWRALCTNGQVLDDQRETFVEGYAGDFVRSGGRFRDRWVVEDTWDSGRPYTIAAEVEGSDAGHDSRGSVRFAVTYDDGGRTATCDSGRLAWDGAPY